MGALGLFKKQLTTSPMERHMISKPPDQSPQGTMYCLGGKDIDTSRGLTLDRLTYGPACWNMTSR